MIRTVCYGQEKDFNSREEAERFYLDCIMWSDGSERDRYYTILVALIQGENYCTDEDA